MADEGNAGGAAADALLRHLPVELESLASGLLQDPVRIEAEPLNSLVSDIEERLYLVNRSSKVPALIALLEAGEWPPGAGLHQCQGRRGQGGKRNSPGLA